MINAVTAADWICLFIILIGIVALAAIEAMCEVLYGWWRAL